MRKTGVCEHCNKPFEFAEHVTQQKYCGRDCKRLANLVQDKVRRGARPKLIPYAGKPGR